MLSTREACASTGSGHVHHPGAGRLDEATQARPLQLRMHAGPFAACLPRTRTVRLHQLHFLQEPAIMCFTARLFLLGAAGKH
jgi:hypothetical protein